MNSNNTIYRNTVVVLSGLTGITGLWLLVDYFANLDTYTPDPFWVFNTAIQIALIGFFIYFVMKSRLKPALWLFIAVIASEVIGRIQSTIETVGYYPDVENIQFSSIPIISEIVVPPIHETAYDAVLSWVAEITAASELVVLVLLLIMISATKKTGVVSTDGFCSNCGAAKKSGNFCPKCGTSLS